MNGDRTDWKTVSGVVCLLLAVGIQMALTAHRNSITWDEGDHLYAGFMSWKTGDFGINPEHPQLVKLVAAAPLLGMGLPVPVPQDRYFKLEGFLGGKDFLFQNDADAMLFRARMASSVFTILLALAVFAGARRMFGTGAGFIALALLVFEPNIIAHSALVTTDVAFSLFLFLSVYAFYRYAQSPSAWKLAAVGAAAGLALASKHTGVFVFPILILLALFEALRPRDDAGAGRARRMLRMAAALVVAGAIAAAILWSVYGFRYEARPEGRSLIPPFDAAVQGLSNPQQADLISFFAKHELLPESYLYGLADVLNVDAAYKSFVLGTIYPHGVWFYFPVALAIKSTLTFLILGGIAVFAMVARRFVYGREILYLALAPLCHLLVAMNSGVNIGIRHVLPLYVFAAVLFGGVAWKLARRNRRWAAVVAALLVFHAASSLRTFPAYLAYANELWGGPSNTHKYLSDSNVDWGQQLKSVRRYLDSRGIRDCHFVYFAGGVVDTGYYGIPCKLLPTVNSLWVNEELPVPGKIDGTILISAGNLSGFEFGPGALNPYEQFKSLEPEAVIDYGVFVYNGRFEIPRAAAIWHMQKSRGLLQKRDYEAALAEARKARTLAPDSVDANALLGDTLMILKQPGEAQSFYERALTLARTVEPEFQAGRVPGLEARLGRIRSSPGQ